MHAAEPDPKPMKLEQITFKGSASRFKQLPEPVNGFMGIGLESKKYGKKFLPCYISWMARHLNRSMFVLADESFEINARVFGHRVSSIDSRSEFMSYGSYLSDRKSWISEKISAVGELVGRYGDRTRMEVMLESELPDAHGDISLDLRLALDFEESSDFGLHVHDCVYGNIRRRIEEYEMKPGKALLVDALYHLKGYVLNDVALRIHMVTSGVGGLPYLVKVGPESEGWYDKIVRRILRGSYAESPTIEAIAARLRASGNEFGTVYFHFGEEDRSGK